MSKKILLDTNKENTRIRFYNGNILFLDNDGAAHIFGNKTERIVSPTTTKQVRGRNNGNVRRAVQSANTENSRFESKRFAGVFDNGFISSDGRKYNPDGTLFNDDACLYAEITLDGEDFVFFTTSNGELHSCKAEDYEDGLNWFDDEYLPDEITGERIKSLYHIGFGDDDEGAIALDDNGNIYKIGYLPMCVDEFFRCTDNISVISIDSDDDESYFCVGLNENGRLKLWTGDCDEDEDYRDFFNTVRYITDVVDFDIHRTIGAAVNSKGKIQLWGDPELIKTYEALIPDEFLEF